MNEHLKRELPMLSFTADEYGWRAEIQASTLKCFGLQVEVKIDTRNIPTFPSQLPEVDEKQAILVALILSEFPRILPIIEEQFEKTVRPYDPEYRNTLCKPHLWIRLADCPDSNNSYAPHVRKDMEWTFVCGRTDNPDFGYHFEFNGTRFIELWSGD